MKQTDKKYLMMVYEEDERYGTEGHQLDFYIDNPAEGLLSDMVWGDNAEELMVSSDGECNEGLQYILYAIEDGLGRRIGSGTMDYDVISEEIGEYEKKKSLLVKYLYEKIGKQYGVISTDYGIQEADLSRLDNFDWIIMEMEISWKFLKQWFYAESEFIKERSECINDSDWIFVYKVEGISGEKYMLFVPSWWM